MICKLRCLDEIKMFQDYWKKADNNWLQKIEPKYTLQKPYSSYCIKTFQYDKSNIPCTNRGNLPYELIRASTSIDIWSFGVLLYQLITGEPFIAVNNDYDLLSGSDMEYIYNWNDEKCKEKLINIQSDMARALLYKILKYNPTDRPTAATLLQHPFFHPEAMNYTNEDLDSIITLKDSIEIIKQTQIEQIYLSNIIIEKSIPIENFSLISQQVLARYTLEIKKYITLPNNTLSLPSMFIIRPLLTTTERQILETEGKSLLVENYTANNNNNNDEDITYEATLNFFQNAYKFYEIISNLCTSILQNNPINIENSFSEIFKNNQEYELILICPMCFKPQTINQWSIKLSSNNIQDTIQWLMTLLPLIDANLAIMKAINGNECIPTLLGYPVSNIPTECYDSFIHHLKHISSIHDYINIEEKLQEINIQQTNHTTSNTTIHTTNNTTNSNYCHKSLQKMIKKFDETNNWSELKCITINNDSSLWCCDNCCNILQMNANANYDEINDMLCISSTRRTKNKKHHNRNFNK